LVECIEKAFTDGYCHTSTRRLTLAITCTGYIYTIKLTRRDLREMRTLSHQTYRTYNISILVEQVEDAARALRRSALHSYAEGVMVLLVVPAKINGISYYIRTPGPQAETAATSAYDHATTEHCPLSIMIVDICTSTNHQAVTASANYITVMLGKRAKCQNTNVACSIPLRP